MNMLRSDHFSVYLSVKFSIIYMYIYLPHRVAVSFKWNDKCKNTLKIIK